MPSPLEWIKDHPFIAAGGAIGVFVVVYIASSGGGEATQEIGGYGGTLIAGPTDAQIAAGLQVQAYQADLQMAAKNADAAIQVAEITKATEIEAAQIASQSAFDLAKLENETLRYQITQSVAGTTKANELATQVALAKEKTAQTNIAASQSVTLAQISAAKSIAYSDIEAEKKITKKFLNVQKLLGKKSIKAQKEVQKKALNVQKLISRYQTSAQTQGQTLGAFGGFLNTAMNVIGKIIK